MRFVGWLLVAAGILWTVTIGACAMAYGVAIAESLPSHSRIAGQAVAAWIMLFAVARAYVPGWIAFLIGAVLLYRTRNASRA